MLILKDIQFIETIEKELEINDQRDYDKAIHQYFTFVEALPSLEQFCNIGKEQPVTKDNAENIKEIESDDKIISCTIHNKDMMVTTSKSQYADDSLESFMKLKNNGK